MVNAWKRWTVAAATAVCLVAGPEVAGASGDGEAGPRLARACARADNLALRTQNLVRILESGPEVEGSLAWLRAQIERATAAGRPQLGQVLQNRLEVRSAKLELLTVRLERLAKIDAICAGRGL